MCYGFVTPAVTNGMVFHRLTVLVDLFAHHVVMEELRLLGDMLTKIKRNGKM